MTDRHVEADVWLAEIAQGFLVRHLAVEHILDRTGNRAGDVLVLDVGTDVRRPVALAVAAAFGVAGRAVIDFVGRNVQTIASLDLCAFGHQLVSVDRQAAAALHACGLRGGFAAAVLRGAVGKIDATAGAVEATGVVETAAGAGGVGGRCVAVLFGQQRHIVAAQRGFARDGFDLTALDRQIAAGLHLHAGAAEAGALLGDVVARDGLLLVFVMHAGAVLLRRLLVGVGVETTGFAGRAAVVGVLRGMHVHIPRGVRRQRTAGLDCGTGNVDVLGTLELEVAVGNQLAAHRGAVLGVLP